MFDRPLWIRTKVEQLFKGVHFERVALRMEKHLKDTEFQSYYQICQEGRIKKLIFSNSVKQVKNAHEPSHSVEKWSSQQLKILAVLAAIVSDIRGHPDNWSLSPKDWQIPSQFLNISSFLCWQRYSKGLQSKFKFKWSQEQELILDQSVRRCSLVRPDWSRIMLTYNLLAYQRCKVFRDFYSAQTRYRLRQQNLSKPSTPPSTNLSLPAQQPAARPPLPDKISLVKTANFEDGADGWQVIIVNDVTKEIYFVEARPRIELNICFVKEEVAAAFKNSGFLQQYRNKVNNIRYRPNQRDRKMAIKKQLQKTETILPLPSIYGGVGFTQCPLDDQNSSLIPEVSQDERSEIDLTSRQAQL